MTTTLSIDTIYKNGRTILSNSYATSPLKIANITEDKKAGNLHLMLMSSSPGILSGDEYKLRIGVGEDCNLVLSTQSYQRLFTMQQGASQLMDVHVKRSAAFCFLPHPLVPHQASKFTGCSNIFLGEDSSLIWGEIVTCGRNLNGESFSFSTLHLQTNIYLHNRIALKENLFIEPANTNFLSIGLGEGFSHQASFICLHKTVNFQETFAEVNRILKAEKDMMYGITNPAVNGLVIRFLGNKGEQIFACLQKLGALFGQIIHRQTNVYAG